MSTPAVIAIPQGDGWRGRTVQGDGYPTWTGHFLLELVRRDGLDKVIHTLVTGRNYAWSLINPMAGTPDEADTLVEHRERLLGERAKLVKGYGTAYTTKQGQCHRDDWATPETVDLWEWVYVLLPSRILIYRGTIRIASLHYDKIDDPNLDKILENIENKGG